MNMDASGLWGCFLRRLEHPQFHFLGCAVHLFGGQKVTAGLCTMHTALVAGKAGLNHLWFVDAASCRHLKAWGTGGGYPLVSRYGNGNLETWKLRLTLD